MRYVMTVANLRVLIRWFTLFSRV